MPSSSGIRVEKDDVGPQLGHRRHDLAADQLSPTTSKSSVVSSARRTTASISRWSSATSTRNRVILGRSPFAAAGAAAVPRTIA